MESSYLITIVLEVLLVVFSFSALRLNYRVYKDNHNPMDLGVFFIILFLSLKESFGGWTGLLGSDRMNLIPYFEGRISLTHIMDIALAMVGLWFILYLYDLQNYYSFPFVLGYFTSAYAFYTSSYEISTNIIIVSVALSTLAHFRNVVKNHNGMSFSIGLVGLMGIFDYFISLEIISYIFRFMYIGIFVLGLTGWWDDNVFYDRAKRQQISSSWIVNYVS